MFQPSDPAVSIPNLRLVVRRIAVPSPFGIRIHLLSRRTGVMDLNAVITAEGENMNTSIAEEYGTAQAPAPGEKPKPAKKARVAPRGAHVTPKKRKSSKKATPAKKAPIGARKAPGTRDSSKTNQVLELLKRPGGVTAKELMKVTGWQPHSVRGFLSGTVGKKMGLAVASTKSEDRERSYSIKA